MNGGSRKTSYLNHFASADTIVPDPTNPQAFNRYSYVINNPIRLIDPSGHEYQPHAPFPYDPVHGVGGTVSIEPTDFRKAFSALETDLSELIPVVEEQQENYEFWGEVIGGATGITFVSLFTLSPSPLHAIGLTVGIKAGGEIGRRMADNTDESLLLADMHKIRNFFQPANNFFNENGTISIEYEGQMRQVESIRMTGQTAPGTNDNYGFVLHNVHVSVWVDGTEIYLGMIEHLSSLGFDYLMELMASYETEYQED